MSSTTMFWIFLMIVMVCFTIIIVSALNREVERNRPPTINHFAGTMKMTSERVPTSVLKSFLINDGMIFHEVDKFIQTLQTNNLVVHREITPLDPDETHTIGAIH